MGLLKNSYSSVQLGLLGLCFMVILLETTNAELTPPYFNLATGRRIYATATCGLDPDGPELYCKLVGANTENDNHYYSVIQGQVCDHCDPSRPDKHHPPENAIDGKENWWQSPPLSRGMKYNEVNLTIDFGQEFHVAYLFIRMGNSPRPGLWTLEKSSDYGKTWSAWQHFSDTPADCETYFGRDSLRPILRDDDVICTTEYSKIVPLENGEIPVMLLNNRPSANNYFNSSVLQEWTRATNIRIRLLRTKNLLGHLMSVARQDPTVTRRYFYSIKDISIGGRCMCNGHADTCDVADPKSRTRLLACICQHDTCGIQCNECCPGFEQKKWRQNTNANPFKCEPCNCFGHSRRCIYDEDVDLKGLSLDIQGNYDGGGVCQDCQHNTEGINCNKCKPKYYRPFEKHWNETDVCHRCNCDEFYSTGNCAEETGVCECRIEFQPPWCDSCAYGYFGYPKCRECECFLNGTEGYHCEAENGFCPCKINFEGHHCKQCAKDYYKFPECKPCQCNHEGSINNECDIETGQCKCLSNFGGHQCERCRHGYHAYPQCKYCDCDIHGTEPDVCDKDSGKCLCRVGFGGPRCDQCLPGYFNYPECIPCNCSVIGSVANTCDISGKCSCVGSFAGKQCTSCSAGFYNYPECLPCNCNNRGSEGISCNTEGQCLCYHNFDGKNCEQCREGFYNFPACEECNCDPAGVIARFAGCGSVPAGELCQCKERVTGRICDQCKPMFWNLNISNPEGCEQCECFLDGTMGTLDTCDSKTGQCACKPAVRGRQCKECQDGMFDLEGGSLFGCRDCGCDIGGARSPVCNKVSGQCNCHPRVAGRTCMQPLTTHYFPTLYQFQFEYEDGYTPSGAHVRYQYDEDLFPEFSRKGYAVFSNIQNEVINEVNIFKSSVYRMVIRYANPSPDNVTATILIASDNPVELDQNAKVLFKPTSSPQFVTVSGSKGEIPSPMVLDPGRYTISIKTDKNVLLDYFVLLPAAYYEASILTRQIENPCELGNLHLCRHYQYPIIAEFRPSIQPFITDGDKASVPQEVYDDFEHLSIIDQIENLPMITNKQKVLKYLVDAPHTGQYVVVIDYITDRHDPEIYSIKVKVSDDEPYNFGRALLSSCLYTTICRQPVVDDDSREKLFFINVTDYKSIEVYHDYDDFGRVAIKSITAIPVEKWTIDFIQPSPVCVMQNGKCVSSTFRTAPDSKKLEIEHDQEHRISTALPINVGSNGTKLIYMDQDNSTISIRSKLSKPGHYVIVFKYYQPNHPQYNVLFRLETGKQSYDGKVLIDHCPSNSGCRQIIRPEGNNWWFAIDDAFTFTMTNNNPQGVWLDYILIVPAEQYHDNLLQEETFDQTKEFIKQCGQDHFHIKLNASEFCKKAVFSLTADYNDGALPCNCDYEGSTSFECDPFGGQCQCRPNVIGRQCEACRTGFYGFPNCKHCDCPLTALCQKDTGECICPPHVTGEKCDQCEPYTYGFHQIIGCEECNCHPMGVERGNLQCDLNNGTCQCRSNIEGRACDECIAGFYNFPECQPCRCNAAGTTFDICDKHDETCFCKKNVVGRACESCADGTYNLQSSNAEGCTKCFCFGKTTRCESAYLRVFNVSMLRNTSINTIVVGDEYADLDQWDITSDEVMINETTLQVDFGDKETINEGLVYFGVLDYILNQNNHLTAYGGYLVYTLFYTTGPFASPLYGPDIILRGKGDVILTHTSHEQPAGSQNFHGSVKIVETNFYTLDKKRVSRSEFMMVLRDLHSIYIRASYMEQSVIAQLSDVYLTMADEDDENFHLYQELPVEKCHCPPGYTGLSCENCAPGYYRDPDGPFGGYCVPCQCNGHADTCDCNTGICQNCKHFTSGEHCEFCIEGYHGNATYGTPHDCMICACPLPYDSNNFATSCEISDTGNKIHCACRTGYTGERCHSCAAGFYGQPEKLGDYCKPCQCSGNINPHELGACDSVTGECRLCLNNTYGQACNLCAPGYYGDAIKLKDCKSCDCEELGTLHCDSYSGTCKCHENVIGERCDRCEIDHYGYDSGFGCHKCGCGIASNNTQCNDHTGECSCKPGVAGRQCDRCAPDHWNYTSSGCVPCLCNKGYSRGFGCNAKNGQCECLPNVIGEKCDNCPYRWVLIKDYGCTECDVCHHALLNVTDALQNKLQPVFEDFQSVAFAYFTSQKLNYYDNLTDQLTPEVRALDPQGVNLTPNVHETDSLEQDVKNMGKQITYAEQTAKECSDGWSRILQEAEDVLDQSRLANTNSKNTIREVEKLAKSFDTAAITKGDNALAEAERILEELDGYVIDLEPTLEHLNKSETMLTNIGIYGFPVWQHNESLNGLRQDIGAFNDKLSDLRNWANLANLNSIDVEFLNLENQNSFANSKFDTVGNQTRDTQKNIDDTLNLILNGELTLKAINDSLEKLHATLDDLRDSNRHVDDLIPKTDEDFMNVGAIVEDATNTADKLKMLAENLSAQYSNITSNSEHAIKAATAYSNIVEAVLEAQKAVKNAKYAAGNATELGDGVRERAGKSDTVASELLVNARNSLSTVQSDLQPHLNKSAENVMYIEKVNKMSEEKLNDINNAMESIPPESQSRVWDEAYEKAEKADKNAKKALAILKPIVKQIPKDLEMAKQLPKDIDTTNKDIGQTKNQVDRVEQLIPRLSNLVDSIKEKQEETSHIGSDLGDRIERLKRQIEVAREIANSIKVGVNFHPNTVLELKTPESVERLATTSRISAYFNTRKLDGFLMYLGNENRTEGRRDKHDDFMAIEIENGYPVLTIDVGNGPERISSNKNVADGKWYQAIVDRTGNNVKFIIREELENGEPYEHEIQQALPGPYSVFNVDKNSKLFVGGYPADFVPPEDVKYSSFEGQIEDLRIGDDEVGLWNFVDGQDNTEGALARDQLLTHETAVTGYRFNGNGYVVLDGRQFNLKSRSSIHFRFKASRETQDGLLFYAGKHHNFIAVELRDGGVHFQYKLGQHMVDIGTDYSLNDNEWHSVEAERDGRKGHLKVDGRMVYQEETPVGTEENLRVSDSIYVGGYPGRVNHSEIIGRNFDGCIDDVQISGTPIDLSRHIEGIGLRPGCPNKFSTILSYPPGHAGYLKKSNVTAIQNFEITLKFKTRQKEGIIFYATNNEQSSTVSLSLLDGSLVALSNGHNKTTANKYNDGDWHVVTVIHRISQISLSVDDAFILRSDHVIPPIHIALGDIYFGGIPKSYTPFRGALPTLAYFSGCINDVTLNGDIVNFASSTDKQSANIDICPDDILDYDPLTVPLIYPDDTYEPYTPFGDGDIHRGDRHSTKSPYEVFVPDTTLPPFTISTKQTPVDARPPPKSSSTTTTTTSKPIVPIPPITFNGKPPPTVKKNLTIEKDCTLPTIPEYEVGFEAGYRFGLTANSRIEFTQIPGKTKKSYEIALQFKTDELDGLLFYMADERHTDFIGLYLKNGILHHAFRSGVSIVNITSRFEYNDGKWHSVIFSRAQQKGRLLIDGQDDNEGALNSTRQMNISPPYYVGGVDPKDSEEVFLNINLDKGGQFTGCVRDVQIGGRSLTTSNRVGVTPCSEQVERGVFFGDNGGYVKLRERFHVGREVTISFDLKPRTHTGILMSVHGRQAYLILQLINGTINFSVDNGEGPIVAVYEPNADEHFCDGEWRTVQAIKSQYVITLTVNSVTSQPAIGSASRPSADTSRPLFMGGHPHLQRVRGLTARKPYKGCIRNVKITQDNYEDIRPEMAFNDVHTGFCSLN